MKRKKVNTILLSVLQIGGPLLLVGAILVTGYYAISYFNNSFFAQYSDDNIDKPLAVGKQWQFFPQLLWMLAFSVAVMLLAGAFTLLQTLFGRWRAVRVFISYQHKHEELVAQLQTVLKNRWISPEFVPFGPTQHDQLIDTVRRHIRAANLVLVLPGSDKSFVDAEILASSTLEKPIVFLKISEQQRTPDTSFTGYPVFDLESLKDYEFAPLKHFILYVTKTAKDAINNYYRATVGFCRKKGGPVLLGFFACSNVGRLIGPIANFFGNREIEHKSYYIVYWGMILIAVVLFSIIYISVIVGKIRARKITRQKIITGDLTFELLSKGLNNTREDEEMLNCILKQSLPKRY